MLKSSGWYLDGGVNFFESNYYVMAAKELFTKEDIRTVMKFQFLQGETPQEMNREL